MKRREFIAALGGAATWSFAADAQPQQLRHIGVLVVSAKDDPDTDARLAGFRQGLERLGWIESRNIRIDYRFADSKADRFGPLAKELVALQPEVILAHSTPIAAALQRESRAIPIVFVSVSDPNSAQALSPVWRGRAENVRGPFVLRGRDYRQVAGDAERDYAGLGTRCRDRQS